MRKSIFIGVLIALSIGLSVPSHAVSAEPCIFTDVPDWGRGYVNFESRNGLANGIGSNLFGSDNKLDAESYSRWRGLDAHDQ